MKIFKKRITVALMIILLVVLPCATFMPKGNSNNKLSAGSDNESIYSGHEDYIDGPNKLPWLSQTFNDYLLDTMNPSNSPIDSDPRFKNDDERRDALQERLKQTGNEYYCFGTNCHVFLARLLARGVSFNGVTLHLQRDIYTAGPDQTGSFTGHETIGTEAYPFDGIYDGNGFTFNIVDPIKSNPKSDINTGFFGAVKNATIMNLTIAATSASFKGNANQTCVGAFAAVATEDSMIINCVNKVNLTGLVGSPSMVGAFIGSADGSTRIINCVDTTNFVNPTNPACGLVGNRNNADLVNDCNFNYLYWDNNIGDQMTFVKEMNRNVFSHLYGKYQGNFFWGIYENKPLLNASSSYTIFYENIVAAEIIKNSALRHIEYYYTNARKTLKSTILISETSMAELEKIMGPYSKYLEMESTFKWNSVITATKLYEAFLSEIEKIISDVYDYQDTEDFDYISFADKITSVSGNARNIFDAITSIYAGYDAQGYENIIKTDIWDMVEFSFNDNISFITGYGKKANAARNLMESRMQKFMIDWNALTVFAENGEINLTDFSLEMNKLMRDAIYDFDAIYYDWAGDGDNAPLIIGLVCGIVVLAGLAVLLFFMLRRSKKVNLLYVNADGIRGRKMQEISEKADTISQLVEAQREKSEAVAELQREKARLITLAQKERQDLINRQQIELDKLLKEKVAIAEKLEKADNNKKKKG